MRKKTRLTATETKTDAQAVRDTQQEVFYFTNSPFHIVFESRSEKGIKERRINGHNSRKILHQM